MPEDTDGPDRTATREQLPLHEELEPERTVPPVTLSQQVNIHLTESVRLIIVEKDRITHIFSKCT